MARNRFLRNTRQRQVILEEMRRLTTHPMASELYEVVRRRMPRISLGTVYRNLELLAQMGYIRKLAGGGSRARFDGDTDPHYHVRCVRCGRVDDVPGLPLGLVKDRFESSNGYEIFAHRLEFIGTCPECRKVAASGTNEESVAPE